MRGFQYYIIFMTASAKFEVFCSDFILVIYVDRSGSSSGSVTVVTPGGVQENHYEQIRQINRGRYQPTASVAVHKGDPEPLPPPSASTATRELEDLMESLSEFKVRTIY